jgi:hypothetical protein
MAVVSEIAPDVYRISIYAPDIDLQFNHFLVRDEQPLLFHAGYKRMFGEINEAIGSLIDPARLRFISFSHFESDECGGLNGWLEQAPTMRTGVRAGGRICKPERFCDQTGAGRLGRRVHRDRQLSLPILFHPAGAAWLGRRSLVRGDKTYLVLLRPVPAMGRCGAADRRVSSPTCARGPAPDRSRATRRMHSVHATHGPNFGAVGHT